MVRLVDPDEKLVEFLHENVTDPAGRLTADTQTFTATASQTRFTLTNQPVCITSVVVNSVAKTKYVDYDIDLVNKQIILATGATEGHSVVVTFKKGTAWIYDDFPRPDLSPGSYPRVSVQWLAKPADRAGFGDDTMLDHWLCQIDILHHKMEKITGTVDSVSMTLQAKDIVRLVRRRVVSAVETAWRTVLGYDMNAPTPKEDHPVPFEQQRDIFRHMLTYEWMGEDVGRGVTT